MGQPGFSPGKKLTGGKFRPVTPVIRFRSRLHTTLLHVQKLSSIRKTVHFLRGVNNCISNHRGNLKLIIRIHKSGNLGKYTLYFRKQNQNQGGGNEFHHLPRTLLQMKQERLRSGLCVRSVMPNIGDMKTCKYTSENTQV